MPEELAQAPQEPAPQEGQGGGQAQALIAGVSMAMGKVAEMLPQIGGSEDDQQAMAQLMSQYQEIVGRVMGSGGEPEQARGQVPVEAGPSGVPMGV